MQTPLMFWDLPNLQIASNRRVASTSVVVAIQKVFPPITPPPFNELPHWVSVATKIVHLLVRDPLERFLSAVSANSHVTADERIQQLPSEHPHFLCQSSYAQGKVILYRFPEQLDEFAKTCGLPQLSWENRTDGEKPTLTATQAFKVRELYREDYQLIDSI